MQESGPRFFDVHTHVQFAAFKDDYREVIERALAMGVWMVNVGTQKDTSKSAVEIANQYKEGVYATIGLHPIHTSKSFHDIDELGPSFAEAPAVAKALEDRSAGKGETAKGFSGRGEEFDYNTYKKLAEDPKVVAIGECGLDYFRVNGEEARKKQKEAFLAQIELAKDVKKPLMIHCRNAFSDLIDVLQPKTYNPKPSVIHFFTGSKDDAKTLLEMGFYFTFGGVITFTRDYDEVIKMIPLDRILSETDAPYVAPAPHRGKRNEPAYVLEVVKKLAEIKGISENELQGRISANAVRVFGLS